MSGVNPPSSGPVTLPVNLPLSGNVAQTFAPWMNLTVNVGHSSNPAVEPHVLSSFSYGRHLGRISDALIVLLNHLPDKWEADEKRAIDDLKSMLHEIANTKAKHGAQPPPVIKLR